MISLGICFTNVSEYYTDDPHPNFNFPLGADFKAFTKLVPIFDSPQQFPAKASKYFTDVQGTFAVSFGLAPSVFDGSLKS